MVDRAFTRPSVPSSLDRIVKAEGVDVWVRDVFLRDGAPLHNPDHSHLLDADVAYLWAPDGFEKKARVVVGQAEEVAFRAGGWQKARQEQAIVDLVGRVPKYLITFSAAHCELMDDRTFCALVEHELYHIAQKKDEFGAPKFDMDGFPKLGIQSHDVEEFFGVVARYGASPQIRRLVELAQNRPIVEDGPLQFACGTCASKIG